MSAKPKNSVWAFLASVQLALLLIALLASTSIIGTVVQQNKPQEHYVEAWGAVPAKAIQALDLNDMYNSVWFLALLGAFSLNLVVCSIDRIPGVVRMVRKDNLEASPEQLLKSKLQRTTATGGSLVAAADQAAAFLAGNGWKTGRREKDGGILLFAQQGGWTRYGAYVVHLSILVIFLGALIGSPTIGTKLLHDPRFAFKGSISLPETVSSHRIFSYGDDSEIQLGFDVRCDFFDIDFYDNGMAKAYVSGLTLIDQGKEVLTTTIEVNRPLIYKGITFYQSSYNELGTPIIRLKNLASGMRKVFPVNPRNLEASHVWQEGQSQGMLQIKDVRSSQDKRGEGTEIDLWMMDSQGPPSMFTVLYNTPVIVERPSGEKYELRIGPHFATGLQVAKDPGVWWVYSGCALMLLGLYVAFFMSHRKIWAWVHERNNGTAVVVLVGSANKNSSGFESSFSALADGFAKKNG